jgi:hypothetical protein
MALQDTLHGYEIHFSSSSIPDRVEAIQLLERFGNVLFGSELCEDLKRDLLDSTATPSWFVHDNIRRIVIRDKLRARVARSYLLDYTRRRVRPKVVEQRILPNGARYTLLAPTPDKRQRSHAHCGRCDSLADYVRRGRNGWATGYVCRECLQRTLKPEGYEPLRRFQPSHSVRYLPKPKPLRDPLLAIKYGRKDWSGFPAALRETGSLAAAAKTIGVALNAVAKKRERDPSFDALCTEYGGRKNPALKTHCPVGHEYAGDNLYVTPRGKRMCRKCASDRKRARREALT